MPLYTFLQFAICRLQIKWDYKKMYIGECPVVLRNILLPSSGLESKPTKKPTGVDVFEVCSPTSLVPLSPGQT
jgi:hypothetical protein